VEQFRFKTLAQDDIDWVHQVQPFPCCPNGKN